MLIAQITDVHIGFDQGNPEGYNTARLEAVLRRLIDPPVRPDMLLMSGDLTEFGDRESYDRLAGAVRDCPFPVWPIPGNHDLRGPLLAAFPQVPRRDDGFVQYAIEADGLRLIMLDTLEEGRHGGAFCETRAAWLRDELAAHPHTPAVLVMHHPPFESGLAWLDANPREPWIARFLEAISGFSQVRAILSGHLHRNIHTVWNGVALTVCGSTAPLVALDLRAVDPAHPDGRALITDEDPVFGLHRWDGQRLVSHFEAVSDYRVFARFDDSTRDTVRHIARERGGA